MKKMLKKIAQVATIAAIGTMMVAGTVMATPITGKINFTGGLILEGSNNLKDATGIDFTGAQVWNGTGSYAAITKYTPVTFNDFSLNPFSGPLTPLWTLTYDGKIFDFDLVSITNKTETAISGMGYLGGTDYEKTLGTWMLTTQPYGGEVSFSATSAVPEPGTIILLGSGLIGLGLYGRRRMKA